MTTPRLAASTATLLTLTLTASLPTVADTPPPTATELGKITVSDSENVAYVASQATSATKTDTELLITPVNVQVIPERLLIEQHATTLDQALSNVSGVVSNAYSIYGEDSITLRGFGTQTVFTDGFRFIEYGGFGLRNLSDAQSIEVLKGPAAILYGALEPGGMINVVTRKPDATPSTSVSVSAGSWQHGTVDADSTGPLNDAKTLLYRLSATYETADGWRDGDWMRKTYVSPSLTWIVSPATRVRVKLSYEDNPYSNDNGTVIPYFNGQYQPISRTQNLLAPYPLGIQTRRDQEWIDWSHDFNADWTVRQVLVRSAVSDSGTSANVYGFDYVGNVLTATQSGYGFKGAETTQATAVAHGGGIRVSSDASWTEFEFTFPRAARR